MPVPLPAAYIDSIRLIKNETTVVRGNVVSDCIGDDVTAFKLHNCKNLVCKDNKALRIKSKTKTSIGFHIYDCTNVLVLYCPVSRANTGFSLSDIDILNVYNITAHNARRGVSISCDGTFRNVALSNYEDHTYYKLGTGFFVGGGTVDVDYLMHFGLESLVESGTILEGSNITENQILYLDEPNDDLTPDYVSLLNNAGTENPLHNDSPDIGGVESTITDEITADPKYLYNIIDNSFWDIDNDKAAEISYIKAFQSRSAASNEAFQRQVLRDLHLKTASSVERFAELFPINARYANKNRTKKRVMDVWYATQNPATVSAYVSSIGAYNFFPSFLKRMEDYADGWIIGHSYVGYDNWLCSYSGLKYGIYIDVLGTSTMNKATSGECYNNTMNCVADAAPVRWFLHEEVEPPGYYMFTDRYHGFENCSLTNMIYNDDFNIQIDQIAQDGSIITPLIPTAAAAASGVSTENHAPSGNVEISLLDRVYSESVDRNVYYRQGDSSSTLSPWISVLHPIGGNFSLTSKYAQFRIDVSGVLRQIDYEFIGLCLRPFYRARDFALPIVDVDATTIYMEFEPGAATGDAISPPDWDSFVVKFADDGVRHSCGWVVPIPQYYIDRAVKVLRIIFTTDLAMAGNAIVRARFSSVASGAILNPLVEINSSVIVQNAQASYVDINISPVITNTSEWFILEISRDSSDPGDSLAADLTFLNGRTL